LPRVILIGNSIGGAAAIRYAAAHPERVDRLVLENPGGLDRADRLSRVVIGGMVRFFAAGARRARWFPGAFAVYYRLILADIDAATVETTRIDELVTKAIVLDPLGSIPLEDASVDIAVSSDVFEHIPLESRARWAAELLRVARLGQAHTFPADSRDGLWASTEADRSLNDWHQSRFGEPERWTAEHLSSPEPLVEEMVALFPESRVRGFANTEVWGKMLRDQLDHVSLLGRARFGLRYAISLRVADRRPPWKGCLLTSGR